MPSAEEFDEFYVQSRRRLLLQTFALTGDLGAARSAVRDAYVAARQHWTKVGRLDEPEDWVRPRAWGIAQRRHNTRPWHKEKGLPQGQTAVLEALQKLSDSERRTLLLTHLAALPMAEIGREIGLTRERAEQLLQSATASTALALDIDSTGIRAALCELEPAVAGTRLPRAPVIRRSGLRRRRVHAVSATVLLVLVTVGAGAFVVEPSGQAPADRSEAPRTVHQGSVVPRAMLLEPAAAETLAPRQRWRTVSTGDNTHGDGINSLCQASRFADMQGLGTWVRTFRTAGKPGLRLTETVEISASAGAARTAYATTLGWFAGCDAPRVHLLAAYDVHGVGDRAQLVHLRLPGPAPRSYFVGVARSGELTVSTLVETLGSTPPPRAGQVMRTLATGVQQLCASEAAGTCVQGPRVSPALPPPTGEGTGMLATTDLPVLSAVRGPWVGTDVERARGPVAATTCDRTDFPRAGASPARTRTFLVPTSDLPDRFGLTQVVGRFPTTAKARGFVAHVEREMRACSDKHLASKVTDAGHSPRAARGSEYALWRLDNEVNRQERTVRFWTGIARVGPFVTQVTFSPVPHADVSAAGFGALVTRARDRLHELDAGTS